MNEHKEAARKFDELLKKNCSKMIEEEKRMNKIISGLVEEIGKRSNDLKTAESRIKKLLGDTESLQGDISKLISNKVSLQNSYVILTEAVGKENKRFEDLKLEYDEIIRSYADKISSKETVLSELRGQIDTLLKSKKSVGLDIVSLNKEYFIIKESIVLEKQSLNKTREEVSEALKTQKKEKEVITEERHALLRIKHEIDRDKSELVKLKNILDEKDLYFKAIDKEQDDRAVTLDYRELELKNISDKINQLIEIHKLKGKV